jgi:phosphoenolpyruvate carboxylase
MILSNDPSSVNKISEEFLNSAIKYASSLVEGENKKSKDAITYGNHEYFSVVLGNVNLVATHAFLSLSAHYGERIACSLDKIAKALNSEVHSNEIGNMKIAPTLEERMIIYRALEANCIAQGNSPSIDDMDAALCRFRLISGL